MLGFLLFFPPRLWLTSPWRRFVASAHSWPRVRRPQSRPCRGAHNAHGCVVTMWIGFEGALHIHIISKFKIPETWILGGPNSSSAGVWVSKGIWKKNIYIYRNLFVYVYFFETSFSATVSWRDVFVEQQGQGVECNRGGKFCSGVVLPCTIVNHHKPPFGRILLSFFQASNMQTQAWRFSIFSCTQGPSSYVPVTVLVRVRPIRHPAHRVSSGRQTLTPKGHSHRERRPGMSLCFRIFCFL